MVIYMKCGHLPKRDSGVSRDISEHVWDWCPTCIEFLTQKRDSHSRGGNPLH